MNNNLRVDETRIREGIAIKRAKREEQRRTGAWGSLGLMVKTLDLRNRWLLYVATFVSALLTGASLFIITMGDSLDIWRLMFAVVMSIIGVLICEPAVLWWLNRVEYHQNRTQLITAIFGLVFSAGLTARTIYSAGELIVWALGDNIFSQFNVVSVATQIWLVHFIPYLVMVHVALGLVYFSVSAESANRRSVENTKRSAATRVEVAKADMEADSAEAMADSLTLMIAELAPQVGIKRAQERVIQFMMDNGFDRDGNGTFDNEEVGKFLQWSKEKSNSDILRQSVERPVRPARPSLAPASQYNLDAQRARFSSNGHDSADADPNSTGRQ